MAGYVRQDTSNNIANGSVIDADDLDGEFDAIAGAFSTATGHTHDGSTAEGAPIVVIGPAQEYLSDGTALYPKADDTYDLGKVGAEWKDLYVDGVANIDSAQIDSLSVSGESTFVSSSTSDALRITQTGSGNALVVEDSSSPDSSPFVVTSAGRVGIGTSSPSVELEIVDEFGTSIMQNRGAVDSIYRAVQTGNTGYGYYAFGDSDDLFVGGFAYNHDDDFLQVNVNNAERMRIDSTGNVGIGRTNPSERLDISGSIAVSGTVDGRDVAADGAKLDTINLADLVTLTGTEVLTNKTLTAPTLTTPTMTGAVLNDGYTEEVFTVTGTTPALSPTNGSIQTWTLSGNSTPTAGTWAAGQSLTLLVDDGTDYTITWTTLAVVWKTDKGLAPTLNTSGDTVIGLWKVGTTIYGARVGDA